MLAVSHITAVTNNPISQIECHPFKRALFERNTFFRKNKATSLMPEIYS